MIAFYVQIAAAHSLPFIAAAAAICLVAGWLVAVMLRQTRRQSAARWRWMTATAVVVGVGVWTTHFVAMLGYRPDLLISYDAWMTMASAAVAIVAVGFPLSMTAITTGRRRRVALGATSGIGIGMMHYVGMSSMLGCTQSHGFLSTAAAFVCGGLFTAAASALPRRPKTDLVVGGLFAVAVCSTHFIAIFGTSLSDYLVDPGISDGHLVLTGFTIAGAVMVFVGAVLSIANARRFDAQADAHSAILATALDNMSNGLVFIDRHNRLKLFNSRYLDMFSVRQGALTVGMTIPEYLTIVSDANQWSERKRRLIGDWINTRSLTLTLETVEFTLNDGRIVSVESCPVVGGGSVITFDDVTDERDAQDKIAHLAFHDALTGLANRNSLRQRMEAGFYPKVVFKLLLIDLDRFKDVNDSFGHKIGDLLLIQVARRIQSVVGADGFVARLGGDEMAVLVEGDLELSMSVAEEICAVVDQPFMINGNRISIGSSIGMCCTDDAASPDELMQRADLALYESKRNGRGRATCYQPGLLEAVTERHQLDSDMRIALEDGQFHLAYQPVLTLSDDSIIGYEALIRWDHPTIGAIPPVKFIPLAEETGQIVAIGKWVLEEACRQAAAWLGDEHVAVNISPVQFKSPLLLAHITGALAKSGLPAHRLEIELTETAMVDDGEQIAQMLTAIRLLGIKVAMDDFGTGYSSLAHLRDFPLDRIKIDRSFVIAAETDKHSMAVLKAVTQMGRDMDIPTLAEGIETNEHLALLRRLGCDAVQGYLIGKPIRMGGFEEDRLSA